MSDQEFILAPATVNVDFQILPVETAINSMAILYQSQELSGLGEWVMRTYEALSPERLRFNEMLNTILTKGISLEGNTSSSFPDYIDWVADQDAEQLRDKTLSMVAEKASEIGHPVDVATLLADKDRYLEMIRAIHEAHYAQKDMGMNLSLYSEAHELMQHPQLMLDRIVEHYRYMWEYHLKNEWERNLPLLQDCVRAHKQVNYRDQTALEALRSVTGRDMSEYWGSMNEVTNVTFVPSAHIGPYNAYFVREGVAYVFFGARMPKGVESVSPALSRSELLVRLNALADDTRLLILELLTQHDELCAQDIMNQLSLSQSSASRHLRQLTATGYLIERRRDVAKCYSLNTDRVDDTLRALQQFLRGKIT